MNFKEIADLISNLERKARYMTKIENDIAICEQRLSDLRAEKENNLNEFYEMQMNSVTAFMGYAKNQRQFALENKNEITTEAFEDKRYMI